MWARSLREMRRRGVNSIAVLLDGTSFGIRASYEELHHELRLINIPTYHIRQGEAIDQALSQSFQGADRAARPYPAR
jgi:hypothetical protein